MIPMKAGPPVSKDGCGVLPIEEVRSVVAVVVDQEQEQDTGDPGECCAPTEPVESSWDQLRDDLFLRLGVHGRSEGRVDPVEEIEQANPEDARAEVKPTVCEFEDFHGVCSIVTRWG